MTPILVDGPAVEPVGLAEMRAYLRVDDAAEDELVAGLVKAARLVVEASSRRILTASRWRLVLEAGRAGASSACRCRRSSASSASPSRAASGRR